MKERRKYPRVNTRIPLEICTDGSVTVAEIINLSSSGACCRVCKHIPLMTSLVITFDLPFEDGENKSEYVNCNGVVVRSGKDRTGMYEVAVFFNEIEESQREKIARYVEKILLTKQDVEG